MPNSIPDKAWTHILADFITKLLLAQGYNSILVVVDCFTKMAHFVPTTEKNTAEGLARLFRNNIWRLYGLPESIISDRGPQFAAGLMREVEQVAGDQNKVVDCILPTNRWTDRKNEPRVGAISLHVHRPLSETVARMARNGRVCLQQ